jgi:hypothetical protein
MISPLTIVVSREEVEMVNLNPALGILRSCVNSQEAARYFKENVEITFHGYDSGPRELFEIVEVRNYVQNLDDKFPYWLYFMSKYYQGLHCLLYCMLPPYLTDEAKQKILPSRIDSLLMSRWFPAMNEVAVFAGLGEKEIEILTDRTIKYITLGRIPFGKETW